MTKAELEIENASLKARVAELEAQATGAVLSDEIHAGLAVARRMIKDGKRLAGFAFSRNDMIKADKALSALDAMRPAPAAVETEELGEGEGTEGQDVNESGQDDQGKATELSQE